MSFSAWLHWPNGSTRLDQARTTAAAFIVRSLLDTKINPIESVERDVAELAKRFLAPSDVADALLDRDYNQQPFWIEFARVNESLVLSKALAEFVLRSPMHPKPSMNRARYFIASGGFSPPILKKETQRKASASHSKLAWENDGPAIPFFYADAIYGGKLARLSPDDPDALKLLKSAPSKEECVRIFGMASAVQKRLTVLLVADSTKAVSSIAVPNDITLSSNEEDAKFPAFNDAQIKLLRSYSVEKYSKMRIR